LGSVLHQQAQEQSAFLLLSELYYEMNAITSSL